MEQTKALNALEPFLALSKSATSPRAAADLVTRATSAPNTFIFTELLQTPQIQALASSDEFAPYLTLLQIFSHGTYSTYTSTPGLPELNDAQRLKLRQLSLLTLAKQHGTAGDAGSQALGYASLQMNLGLPSRQALEELVISAVYAGLLKAQLNPKASLVQINTVSPLRDVAPTAIDGLLSSLQAWAGRCEATLQSLSCQMTQLHADADRRAARAAARARETHKLIEDEKKGGKAPKTRVAAAAAVTATAAAAVPPRAFPASQTTTAAANSAASTRSRRTETPTTTTQASGLAGSFHPVNNGGGNNNNTLTTTATTTTTPTTSTNTTTTTNPNQMSSMLMVGVGSSSLAPGEAVPTADPAGTAHLQVNPAVMRGGKDAGSDAGANEGSAGPGMDLDVEMGDGEDTGGAKRANKRKLDP